ncbi:MAG: hypothetical protein ACM3JB_08695 [Acidobacteriaceae bacterium]
MRSTKAHRRLAPAYLFQGDILVWRCSRCRKMFFLDVAETVTENPPARVSREFTRHFCSTPMDEGFPSEVISIITGENPGGGDGEDRE